MKKYTEQKKYLNEGISYNTEMLQIEGEYSIEDALKEAEELLETLKSWQEMDVDYIEGTIYDVGAEIIPLWKKQGEELRKKVQTDRELGNKLDV